MSTCPNCGVDHNKDLDAIVDRLAKKLQEEIDREIMKEIMEEYDKLVRDSYDRAMKGL